MRYYIIWLKSGGYIEGKVDIDNANSILNQYNSSKKTILFSDTDGTVTVRRNRIEAIGINVVQDKIKAGF